MGHIRATHLGKAYKRYPHRWGRAAEWLGLGCHHTPHWVLHDINLDIAPGEAVGIIGLNGAGKSTLLKLITGTSRPTCGQVEVGGRVSALLELGIGFHPEFTGRQNVWNAARLAGLEPAQIQACMPDIQAFADIGDYLDQPVRTYSSGMQVRLAFAVATATRPDVLVVDEALAVGDVFFQQKCFERIQAFREQGTTLLFVSHAMSTVYTLCDRALLLEGGHVTCDDEPRRVIDLYNARLASQGAQGELQVATGGEGDAPVGSYGNDQARITGVEILHNEQPVHALPADSEVTVRITAAFQAPVADPHVGLQVRDRRGEILYMTHTHGQGLRIGPVSAGAVVQVDYRFRASLIPGDYTLTVGIADQAMPGGHVRRSLVRRQDAAGFTLTRNLDAPHWDGLCNLAPTCRIQRINEGSPASG
ncbi:lipopolysaccharide transport system ATP-binding protein [Ectothiorhodospira mobilis]|uniref:Lipopolysaccharide transport system ATP-binding protein n=1 Tax=Ectothiorhodospira mobilis TaxID=195064 RepID=A0A1I4SJE8_ECTMO|nr:ABC transporter ATP-binding protein [Ectothiorhodospira mobilis]SFM64393.1 lipopolysaccharide transport system ATP-binding protein [Ectothiorhodospira mobilis]